ncbi:BrnT family toxin [Rhizobium puerariae]|uniref:BrnT family toxin n=1 Tax=Rhizobium puerariae TaxID=1585791 RepID=A0ABV6A9P4_9HYPH
MKIIFDPPKRETTLKERKLDMADLTVEFFEEATIFDAKLGRLKAVGLFGDDLITVIFKLLGTEAISVISMRRASRKERKSI